MDLPICAKCNKPVEFMRSNQDFINRRTVYWVRCHGETEICYIDDIDFVAGSVKLARAFTRDVKGQLTT